MFYNAVWLRVCDRTITFTGRRVKLDYQGNGLSKHGQQWIRKYLTQALSWSVKSELYVQVYNQRIHESLTEKDDGYPQIRRLWVGDAIIYVIYYYSFSLMKFIIVFDIHGYAKRERHPSTLFKML